MTSSPGRDIPFAKSQMGHRTAAMLLDVYAAGVHPDEAKRLAALVRGEDWAASDQSSLAGINAAGGTTREIAVESGSAGG